jgi:glycosyltransferase involved in cell wall biosynthesis
MDNATPKVKKPRVVMIGPALSVKGGVATVVNNYYAAGLTGSVNMVYIGTMVDGIKIRKLLQAIWAFLRFLFYLPCMDILHAHMASDISVYRKKFFIDMAFFFRKKIIIRQNGGDFQTFFYEQSSREAQQKIRKTLNKAHTFIVLSSEWKDFFINLVAPEKIMIMQNAVPLPKMKKMDYSGHKLLFMGRLSREKCVGELLAVMPRLKESFPDVHLYLGGVWIDKGLEEQAAGMAGYVTCLGWIDAETRLEYADLCSIFVLPTYYEGQPNSLLEAMAAGMASLATAVGGIPQMIQDGLNGRLIAPRDADALYDGLSDLLADEDLRRKYGEAARRHMEANYDITKTVENLVCIYRQLSS